MGGVCHIQCAHIAWFHQLRRVTLKRISKSVVFINHFKIVFQPFINLRNGFCVDVYERVLYNVISHSVSPANEKQRHLFNERFNLSAEERQLSVVRNALFRKSKILNNKASDEGFSPRPRLCFHKPPFIWKPG